MGDRVAAMRADFERLVAVAGWSTEDAMEMGLAIKAAIDAGDDALAQCWAGWLAAELAAAVAIKQASTKGPSVDAAARRDCRTCANTSRPGLVAFPGYCDRRGDLAPIYGASHPLRQLPGDKGASCSLWRAA